VALPVVAVLYDDATRAAHFYFPSSGRLGVVVVDLCLVAPHQVLASECLVARAASPWALVSVRARTVLRQFVWPGEGLVAVGALKVWGYRLVDGLRVGSQPRLALAHFLASFAHKTAVEAMRHHLRGAWELGVAPWAHGRLCRRTHGCEEGG